MSCNTNQERRRGSVSYFGKEKKRLFESEKKKKAAKNSAVDSAHLHLTNMPAVRTVSLCLQKPPR